MRTFLKTLLVGAFIVGLAASSSAQNVSVSGTVADETKSVLPGATVTATDLETGRHVHTGDEKPVVPHARVAGAKYGLAAGRRAGYFERESAQGGRYARRDR